MLPVYIVYNLISLSIQLNKKYWDPNVRNAVLGVWDTKMNKKVKKKISNKQNSAINSPTSAVPFPIS